MCKKLVYLICFVLVFGLADKAGAAPPAPWQEATIGGDTPAGSTVYTPTTQSIAITADGHDIWDDYDDFHYVYQPWSGDGEIYCRVVEWTTAPYDWSKAGVMFRDDLTDGSMDVYMVVTGNSQGGGSSFQWRDTPNSAANIGNTDYTISGVWPASPYWVRLVRTGNSFSGYVSPDGSAWTQVGSAHTNNMADPIYIGLCVTSHSAGNLVTATIDNVGGDVLFGAFPWPSKPQPADGSTIDGFIYPPDYIYVVLYFEEGDWADSHVVYFSDNEALVTALDPSVSLGGPPDPLNPRTFYAGVPLPEWTPYNDSLVRGTTYYWCAVTTDVNGTPWQGPTWDFYVALNEASNPRPADGARFIRLNPTLRWGAGAKEVYNAPHVHQIYFGTTWADVNSATDGGPLDRGDNLWDDTTWEPNSEGGLTLDYSTDYYWRIDEKHGTFGAVVLKGPVWKFTTGREGGGVRADYFEFVGQGTTVPTRAVAFASPPVLTRIDPEINFNWGDPGSPDPCIAVDYFASRWSGAVEAGWTETYVFNARTDDGVRLWIGGELVVDDWVQGGMRDNFSTPIDFVAGQRYSLMMEQYENTGGAGAELFWQSP